MSDETDILPEVSETERAQLAWSADETEKETLPADRQEATRQPLPRTLKALLGGVLVCGVGVAGFVVGQHEPQIQARNIPSHLAAPAPATGLGALLGGPPLKPAPPSLKPSAPPAPAPAPSVAKPAPRAVPSPRPIVKPAAPMAPPQAMTAPPSADQRFLGSLARDGLRTTTPESNFAQARAACTALGNGSLTVQQFINGTQVDSPALTPQQAAQMTYDAIDAYCPQFDTRR
jgi:hypothetical protein